MKIPFKTPALIAALALTTVGSLTACGGSSSSVAEDCQPKHADIQTVNSGKITVGVTDVLPYSSYNSGDPKGIDVDIIKKFAEENCLEPNFQQASYADAIQSITGSTIDLATGDFYRTDARLKVVDYSATIYLDGLGIVSRNDAKTIKEIESAKAVGTVDGYLWNDDLKKILGDKLKTYPSSVELKADFQAKRIDVAVDAYGSAALQYKDEDGVSIELANKNPDSRVQSLTKAPQVGFPLTKGNSSLTEALDDSIVGQRESGSIKKLLEKENIDPSLVGTPEELKEVYSVPES